MEDWADKMARKMYPRGQVKQVFSNPKYTAAEIGEAKRSLVLDLLACRNILSKGNDPSPMVWWSQCAAIRLTKAGVNWRNHTVRSKKFKGKLGEFFDEFKPYQSSALIEV